ncbi:MAG: SRPBCC family protein [Eudoraea sp.]|nr:SRPBCC family protein [Eudoraea sp.]
MHIETPKKTIEKSNEAVYTYLTDLKNFENLMPESIDKFEIIDEDTFLFALKGMPQIVLKRKEQVPFERVVLGAASEKLPFTLSANITALDENSSEVMLNFEGEFNAMMAMMIKNPITNFMGTLSDNLTKM